MAHVRSLSGHELSGAKLVRLTYFDDAGLFNQKQEPFIVIGGCMVDADRQLVALEEEIAKVAEKHIPEEDRDGFVFHATALWSGSKYLDRDEWPLERRFAILRDLVRIPRMLDIPLTFGFQDRSAAERATPNLDWTSRDLELSYYADTYARFAESVERSMREIWPDEITIIFGEDNDAIRAMVKVAHNHFRDPAWVKSTNPSLTYFPFKKIKEGVHFSPKPESMPLQIADLVTFFVKKRLMRDKRAREFYAELKHLLLFHPAI